MSPDSTDSACTFLRPFGYVDSEPVAEPLGIRRLFIGNRHAADSIADGRSFETVVSLTAEKYPCTTHHHPLVDGPAHEWDGFKTVVETVRRRSRLDEDVLVHCNAGVSRSTAVLATAIAAETERSFRASLTTIQRARQSAVPHPSFVVSALSVLATVR